ncbi:MAG: PDZ domain-containing protein [Planctomycetes bacterium]|nr:PDZ domain-containing protein [Planctomycetota bacterium]
MKPSLLVVASILPFLVGCRTYTSTQHVGSKAYVLASRDLPDGAKETYQLEAYGTPSVRQVREFDRERPFLGLQVQEIDKGAAERRGVKPYSGLLVTGTYPKSSAADAGVLAGDVLLSLDGRETVYLPQVSAIEAALRDGQLVTAKVLRGQDQQDLPLSVKLLKERVTEQQSILLDKAQPHERPYAGLTLGGIPAVWCERIFGQKREAVVVTEVEVGSPAWLAGLRGGDVIDTVDGAPVPTVQELSARIAAEGPGGATMQFGVRRGPGPVYAGAVELEDYSGEAKAWVPLVFWMENGTYEDRWSIGPFGLLMSNRNRYVANNETREVETHNVFKAVLGLFRVETSPTETEVRLLWIIRFET